MNEQERQFEVTTEDARLIFDKPAVYINRYIVTTAEGLMRLSFLESSHLPDGSPVSTHHGTIMLTMHNVEQLEILLRKARENSEGSEEGRG